MHTPNRLPSAPAEFDRRAYVVRHEIERGVFPGFPVPCPRSDMRGGPSGLLAIWEFNPCNLVSPHLVKSHSCWLINRI